MVRIDGVDDAIHSLNQVDIHLFKLVGVLVFIFIHGVISQILGCALTPSAHFGLGVAPSGVVGGIEEALVFFAYLGTPYVEVGVSGYSKVKQCLKVVG